MNLQINETENYLLFFPTKGYSCIQNVLQTKTKVQLATGVEREETRTGYTQKQPSPYGKLLWNLTQNDTLSTAFFFFSPPSYSSDTSSIKFYTMAQKTSYKRYNAP